MQSRQALRWKLRLVARDGGELLLEGVANIDDELGLKVRNLSGTGNRSVDEVIDGVRLGAAKAVIPFGELRVKAHRLGDELGLKVIGRCSNGAAGDADQDSWAILADD